MLQHHLCSEECTPPETHRRGEVLPCSPVSSTDFGREFVMDSYDMLPELSIFDPIMNSADHHVNNKDKDVRVKKTSVIFPAQNEELSKFESEPDHK